MGNSRSRNRSSRAIQRSSAGTEASGGRNNSADVQLDVQRIAELLYLRQELEQRQEAFRTSLETRRRSNPLQLQQGEEGAPRQRNDATGGVGVGGAGAESPNFRRSFLRRFLQHHLILEYLERNPELLSDDDDEDNNNGGGGDSDTTSLASSTFEGVPELFDREEAAAARAEAETEEKRLRERAQKIRVFRARVLDIFESQKNEIAKKINAAVDVQQTLRDLLTDHDLAQDAKDADRTSFIKALVDEIHGSADFVDQKGIRLLGRDLDDIGDNVAVLKELTSVKGEDEVMCTVCLSCPTGIIWDCIRCDHIVCNCCKARISSCPTCRVRFRSKAPRRNRWAERLARLQRERMTTVMDDDAAAATSTPSRGTIVI